MRYFFAFLGLGLFSAAAWGQPLAGDADRSGSLDAVDVQLVVNVVLGVLENEGADIDLSRLNNAVDVQLVVNAVLGITIDTDGDGLADQAEENIGTDVDIDDTDGDGVVDGQEILNKTDPLVNETEVPDAQVYDAEEGLTLRSGPFTVAFPPGMQSLEGELLLLRMLTDEERLAGGLPDDAGFNTGFELGPEGLAFDDGIVQVRVAVNEPEFIRELPVVSFDDASGQWGGAAGTRDPGDPFDFTDDVEMMAGVGEAGQLAIFEVDQTGRYQVWDPPVPDCEEPGLEPLPEEPVAASPGSFFGLPFSLSPNYLDTDASFLFTPDNGQLGISLVNVDIEHPVTGETVTLEANLHSAETVFRNCFALGLILPDGLSGQSQYSDEVLPTPAPISGLMYFRVKEGKWVVNTYGVFESGIVLGTATGDL